MPAHRRQKINKKIIVPKKGLIIVTISLAILAFILSFFASSAIKSEKFVLSYQEEDSGARVEVYDFSSREITEVMIPGDVYINAAYGYGEWRLASLYKLGQQENLSGELTRMSLVKNFHFPIDAWVEGTKLSLTTNSSMTIRQKLQLLWFSLRTPSSSRVEIDLSEGRYLEYTRLPNGDEGYMLSRELPPSLGTAFTTLWHENRMLRVGIYDTLEGGQSSINNVSEVIHILGADWAVIEKPPQDIDCIIRGDDSELLSKIESILKCRTDDTTKEGNFDVEIVIGNKFKERF